MTEPSSPAPLAAFDFDGTLTVRDSFLAFIAWRASLPRLLWGALRLTPAAFRYLADRDRGRLKAAVVGEFMGGVARARLEADAAAFAEAAAHRLLRPDAVREWESWRRKGATLAIVTASPELTIAPFARILGADILIGTRLAFDDQDRVRGALVGVNCRAEEKAVRLRERFGPDVRLAAAYGDTRGDHEMLAMADAPGYRVFSERP